MHRGVGWGQSSCIRLWQQVLRRAHCASLQGMRVAAALESGCAAAWFRSRAWYVLWHLCWSLVGETAAGFVGVLHGCLATAAASLQPRSVAQVVSAVRDMQLRRGSVLGGESARASASDAGRRRSSISKGMAAHSVYSTAEQQQHECVGLSLPQQEPCLCVQDHPMFALPCWQGYFAAG